MRIRPEAPRGRGCGLGVFGGFAPAKPGAAWVSAPVTLEPGALCLRRGAGALGRRQGRSGCGGVRNAASGLPAAIGTGAGIAGHRLSGRGRRRQSGPETARTPETAGAVIGVRLVATLHRAIGRIGRSRSAMRARLYTAAPGWNRNRTGGRTPPKGGQPPTGSSPATRTPPAGSVFSFGGAQRAPVGAPKARPAWTEGSPPAWAGGKPVESCEAAAGRAPGPGGPGAS